MLCLQLVLIANDDLALGGKAVSFHCDKVKLDAQPNVTA